MLSAESAAGSYPEESVLMQQRIINRVEGDKHYSKYLQSNRPKITDGSSASAVQALVSAGNYITDTADDLTSQRNL